MCSFLELGRKKQSIEDTIADLEEEMLNHEYDSIEMDHIFDSLEKYEKCLKMINFKIEERDLWSNSHISITSEETESGWYSDHDENQITLEV